MNASMESVSGETPEIGTADEGKVKGTLRGVQWLRSMHGSECASLWTFRQGFLSEVLERNLAQIYTFVDIQIQIFS